MRMLIHLLCFLQQIQSFAIRQGIIDSDQDLYLINVNRVRAYWIVQTTIILTQVALHLQHHSTHVFCQ